MPPMSDHYQQDGFTVTPELSAERQTRFSAAPELGDGIEPGKNYRAVLETSKGRIVVELFADDAPVTVNSFAYLLRHHYYDGIKFHRVIDGFMAQAGDPTGTGAGGPGYDFEDEPNDHRHRGKGILSMANRGPNTNGSQFFIVSGQSGVQLPPQYSLFGQVVKGLDVVDAMQKVAVGPGDRPVTDVTIRSVAITVAE